METRDTVVYDQRVQSNVIGGMESRDVHQIRVSVLPNSTLVGGAKTVTRICAAEMAIRYAALCACRKVHT